MRILKNFCAIVILTAVPLLLCSCSPAPLPGGGTATEPDDTEKPPVTEPEIDILGFAGSNENFDMQKGTFPVDNEIRLCYMNDPKEYAPLFGYIHPARNFNTFTSEEFIESYYEPMRKNNPKYIARKTIGLDDTGQYTMWCYTFTPENYKTSVYIQAGVHGRNEFESYYAIAMMLHLITDAEKGTDPYLRYLRENVRFVVVPVINVFDVSRRAEIKKGLATGGSYSPNNGNNKKTQAWYDPAPQESLNVRALLEEYKNDDFAFALDAHTDPEGLPGWGGYLTPYADDMPEEVQQKILAVANWLYDKNIVGKVKYEGKDLLKAFMGPNKDYPKNSLEWRTNHDKEDYTRYSLYNSFATGIFKDYGIYGLIGEHGARKFGEVGSKIEMLRAVELYLNHILVHLENVEK